MNGNYFVNKKEKYYTKTEAEELYWINFGLKMKLAFEKFIVSIVGNIFKGFRD